jgi:hypothetical protein
LSLCGVEDEIIAQEYALTDRGLSRKWKESVIEHLMENPALKGNLEGAWNMIGAKYVACPSCMSSTNEVFSELRACS